MSFLVQFALVFFALCAVDMCWTFYIAKVSERRALAAANWSSLIMVCGAFATVSYVEDKRLLIAAVSGAWVGTYLTIRWGKASGT